MKYLLAPAAVLATVAILFSAITPAHACTCATPSTVDRIADADAVVVGESVSTSVVVRESDEREQLVASIDVARYLKGSGPRYLSVNYAFGASCHYAPLDVPGRWFLLFLLDGGPEASGDYLTSFCSGNAELRRARSIVLQPRDDYVDEVLAVTGPGEPPEAIDLPREAFWALAIVLPVAFLAAATVAPWRRR